MSKLSTSCFGQLGTGQPVTLYRLSNGSGMTVSLMDLGAAIVGIETHDQFGQLADITLGFDCPNSYLGDTHYMGAVVGRYANRIAGGRLVVEGREYLLDRNSADNHLHGGAQGFHQRLWQGAVMDNNRLRFTLESADGDQGYPGSLSVQVTYTLTSDNRLCIDYRALSDKPTVLNLTQHSYFNLAGHDRGDVLDHLLALNADCYLPVNGKLIPTGEFRPVANTAFDFRSARRIGDEINGGDEQLQLTGGYDHNWVLTAGAKMCNEFAAWLYEPRSGRTLTVLTDQPGIQCYSANYSDASILGKKGACYPVHGGICLETQHFPDSPNQSSFPSTQLLPGEEYTSRSEYVFGVEKATRSVWHTR